jgi:hypothetical protein
MSKTQNKTKNFRGLAIASVVEKLTRNANENKIKTSITINRTDSAFLSVPDGICVETHINNKSFK